MLRRSAVYLRLINLIYVDVRRNQLVSCTVSTVREKLLTKPSDLLFTLFLLQYFLFCSRT